jgi:hypothetical protein
MDTTLVQKSVNQISNSIRTINDGSIGEDKWLQAIATVLGVVLTGVILWLINRQTLKNADRNNERTLEIARTAASITALNSKRDAQTQLFQSWASEIREHLALFITYIQNDVLLIKQFIASLFPAGYTRERVENEIFESLSNATKELNFLKILIDRRNEQEGVVVDNTFLMLQAVREMVPLMDHSSTLPLLHEKLSQYTERELNLIQSYQTLISNRQDAIVNLSI